MQQQIKRPTSSLRIAHQSTAVVLQRQINALQRELDKLKKEPAKQLNPVRKSILVKVGDWHQSIFCDDILFCQAHGNYTQVHTLRNSFLLSKTLKATKALLPSNDFIRCHQSYLVNKKMIDGYHTKNGMFVNLKNGVVIPVSRRMRKNVLALFQ